MATKTPSTTETSSATANFTKMTANYVRYDFPEGAKFLGNVYVPRSDFNGGKPPATLTFSVKVR